MKNVCIEVDTENIVGVLPHYWNYIGMDECNYISSPEGREILDEFGRFEKTPYYVRSHFILCNGNGHGFYKWGSTNVYREDQDGTPIYTYEYFDGIFDGILASGCKPFVELGFMPIDMVDPGCVEEREITQANYKNHYHTCPPKDYSLWYDLITHVMSHFVERYGADEIKTWYFELWNEPDIFYWSGSPEEYFKLYDYTAAAIEAVMPEARIGGPAVTGPSESKSDSRSVSSAEFLDKFLKHCSEGRNSYSNEIGTRLDYITFHAKGGGFAFNLDDQPRSPSTKKVVEETKLGLEIVARNGYQDREIVLSETDPDGWAAGGIYDNRNMNFRNTSYYPAFVASSFHQIHMLSNQMGFDVKPLTWAFVFRGERCFEGTRAFRTQGIDKPILHYFKMMEMMGDNLIELNGGRYYDVLDIDDPWDATLPPQVSGYAAKSDEGIQVMLYSHHDNQWLERESTNVSIDIGNIDFDNADVVMYRVDQNNCSAHEMWKSMGSPHYPDAKQKQDLVKQATLVPASTDKGVAISNRRITIEIDLPLHALALIAINRT